MAQSSALSINPASSQQPLSSENCGGHDEASCMDIFAAARAKIKQKKGFEPSQDCVSIMEAELVMYSNVILEETITQNPFQFWKENSSKFPQIFNVAVDVLSIPATSAPCERIFSRAGFVLGRNRHNLDDQKLEAEVFYKFNNDFLS